MSFDNIFSLAQITGYAAFFIGLCAYSQKRDIRLKLLSVLENAVGIIHYFLMENPASAAIAFVSTLRSLTAMRCGNAYIAVFFVLCSILTGSYYATSWLAILPIAGASVMTLAIFLLKGEVMRYAIILGSLLWLANNIIIGSIGGTCQELVILVANSITIIRLRLK